ncbi:superoxide dismutase family protein [Sphingomonas sp.]
MRTMRWMAVATAAMALAGCGSNDTRTGNDAVMAANADDGAMLAGADNATASSMGGAVAELATADGSPAGRVTATDTPQGIALALTAQGLEAGERGVHVHATGRCDPPDFQTAGAHWNPLERQHGLENPRGAHAGDMPNLTVAADGKGSASYTLSDATVAAMLEGDGSAFIIHAAADDQRTDPSGDSGDRIACGVFRAG